ncbi:hypothetical protein AB0K54_32695, partial [Streptomyces niveus]
LAVIALKSELAEQLARRGGTEQAAAQMAEVQRPDARVPYRRLPGRAFLSVQLSERRAVSRRAGVDRSRTASGAYRVAAHGTSVINEGCGGAGRFLRRPSTSAHRCAFRPTPGPGTGDSGGVAGETRAGVVG